MFKLLVFPISTSLLILFSINSSNAQNKNLVGLWKGKLVDSIGEFDYQLNLNEEKDGKYIGTSVSNSAGFYCETNIVGIQSGNKLVIIESGIKKTNFEKKQLVCLLKLDLVFKNNLVEGIYSPINNKSNCLSGRVLLKKQQIKLIPNLNQIKTSVKTNDINSTLTKNINKLSEKVEKNEEIIDQKISISPEINKIEKVEEKIDKRESKLLKTIILEEDEAELFIYDNGVIDGDIITLIDNNRILFKKVLLSQKPILFKINNLEEKSHEIQFFAENLGEISPNTGLLVIKTKTKKIELFFSSDLIQSSMIKIILK